MPKTSKVTKTTPENPELIKDEVNSNDFAGDTPDEPKRYKVKPSLDPTMEVPVINGFNGKLVYKSRKTGERIEWEGFGDEQYIELAELRNAKNSYKPFFINNWFLFDDPEIIKWLGVEQYYKNALTFKEFDGFFDKPLDKIKDALSIMSKGQKKSLAFRARQMIADGTIDSIKLITALEEGLGIELVER